MGNCVLPCEAVAEAKQQEINQEIEVGQLRRKGSKMKLLIETSQEDQLSQNVKRFNVKLVKADMPFITKAIDNHFLFSQLNPSEREEIAAKLFYCQAEEGDYIFKQGDRACAFFILCKGECELIVNNETKKKFGPGDGFGEMALLYGKPRSASVRALCVCGLWAISRSTFRQAIQEITVKNQQESKLFLDKVQFFNMLTEAQKEALSTVTITEVYQPGVSIVRQGELASSFYLIKKGTVSVSLGGKEVKKMGQLQTFGEQALLSEDSLRSMTVTADTVTVVMAIGRQSLVNILGDKFSSIVNKNKVRWAFEKLPELKGDSNALEQLLGAVRFKQYNKGYAVCEKGKPPTKLMVSLESPIVNQKSEVVCQKQLVFGANFDEARKKGFQQSAVLREDSMVGEVAVQRYQQILMQQRKVDSLKAMKLSSKSSIKGKTPVTFESLSFLKRLGAGQSSKVYLVAEQKTGALYALKTISKSFVKRESVLNFLKNELKVMELTAGNPHLMGYVRYFKDSANIYFLLEYINGEQLYNLIREIGLLKYEDARYLTAAILVCLMQLHQHSIVYRDLKPENVMVDQQGLVKLIDMGTAKFLDSKVMKKCRTATVIGTPHYMAPEIITGKGYSFGVDLWSLGVCLYQFMCGGVPFGEQSLDPFQIYDQVLNKAVGYPTFFKDSLSKKLMGQLLSRVSQARLGGSYLSLKAHAWFQGVDWEGVQSRRAPGRVVAQGGRVSSREELRGLQQARVPLRKFIEKECAEQFVEKPYEWEIDF